MDWIKKNPDRFALAVLAFALLAASVFAILKSLGFTDALAAVQQSSMRNDKVPELDKKPIEVAQERFEKPVTWAPQKGTGSMFVAWKYLVDPVTKQVRRLGGDDQGMLHPPVPDAWLIKYELDVLTSGILQQDPDKDGFSVLDEFQGADRSPANGDADSTNPVDAKSHPPYHTKLYLGRYIRVPFRLKFNAIDGDPKKDKPEKLSFQINTLDLRTPTVFLKLGEKAAKDRFTLEKFEYKVEVNPNTSAETDVSELTLVNNETGDKVVLVLDKVTDSPDSFALLRYIWPNPPQDITVKKLQEFVLRPEVDKKYKLIDIKETEAQIQLPSGEKYTVPLLPK